MSQADCYCLPTEYAEGFPTTLLEAAACRCPIVCTHTAGTGELLPGEDYAMFVEDTRPETLAAALQTVWKDFPAAERRAQKTLENLSARFTWQAVFATMMKTAQDACAQRAKR